MADYYGNNSGGSLGNVPTLVDTGLLSKAVDESKTDYSDVISKLVAQKEAVAQLAVASDTHKQIDLIQAHQDAALAKAKSDKAASDALRAQLEYENSPDMIAQKAAARAAQVKQSIVDAQTESRQNDQLLAELRAAGGNPDDYVLGAQGDGSNNGYDYAAIANDIPKLKTRQSLGAVPTLDSGGNIVPPAVSTDSRSAGALSGAPTPTDDTSPASPDAAATAAPADASPIALPPIQTSDGPVQPSAPLASAPAPGGAPVDAATAAANSAVVPPALQINPAFVPQMRQQVALAGRKIQLENYKKTGFMVPATQGEIFKQLGLKTEKEVFVDPKTQNSYEALVTRDEAGRIWNAPQNPVLHERSKTQQTIDTEAAKDYQDYTTNQGASRDKNDIATLDSAIAVLQDGKTTVSGALTSLLPAGLRNVVLSDKGLAVPQMIKSVVQNHLKEIFGGRISNMEVKNAMELVFNPALSEGTNAATAQRLRKNLVEALGNKQASMQYFGAHGTLEGYTPKSLTDAGSPGSTSTSTATGAATAGQPREGQIGVFGGRKYSWTKDEQTGKMGWGALQ